MTKEIDLDLTEAEDDPFEGGGDDMFGDMDFDELDGGADPKKGDRNPIATAFSGFKGGFTEEVESPAMVDKAVDSALPSNMSSAHTNIKDFNKNIDKTMKKAVKQHGFALKDALKAMGHDGFADKFIEKYTEDSDDSDDYREKSEDEVRNELLNSIFAAQAEETSARIEVDEARANLDDAKDTKRHEHSTVLQTQTLDELKNLGEFNTNIVFKYQRANLETNLKSYGIQRSILKLTKEYSDAQLAALKSIVLNTSLPEVNKIKASEKLAASLSSKMSDSLADGFTDNGGLAKLVGQMSSEKMNAGINKVFGWKSKYDQLKTAGDPIEVLSGAMGGMAAETLASGAGSLVARSKLLDNAKVANAMATADMGIDTFKSDMIHKATTMTTASTSDGGIKSMLKGIGRMILPGMAGESGLGGISLKPDSYLQKHHLAQTDVIPQLLAKILSQVVGIRTGTAPKEIEFDYTTLRFRKKLVSTHDPMTSINNKFSRSGNQQKARVSADELLGDNGTAAERKQLARTLLLASIGARAGGKNTTSMREFYESKAFKGLTKAMKRKIKLRLEGKEVELYRSLRTLKSTTADPKATLERLIKDHGHAPLMDAGILKMDDMGKNIVVDKKKYEAWLTKDVGKFANGIGGMTSEAELRATGRLGKLESYSDAMKRERQFQAGIGNAEGDVRKQRVRDANLTVKKIKSQAKKEGRPPEELMQEHLNSTSGELIDVTLGIRKGISSAIVRQIHEAESKEGFTAVKRLASRLRMKLPDNIKRYMFRQDIQAKKEERV